jgi:hypothetical protein
MTNRQNIKFDIIQTEDAIDNYIININQESI